MYYSGHSRFICVKIESCDICSCERPVAVRDDFTHICRVNARLDKHMHDSSLASTGRLAVGELVEVVSHSTLLHLVPTIFHLDDCWLWRHR